MVECHTPNQPFLYEINSATLITYMMLKFKSSHSQAPAFWAVLLTLSVASVARAQSGSENLALFGLLGQGNASVNGVQSVKNNSCAPTAVTNGLTYLEKLPIVHKQSRSVFKPPQIPTPNLIICNPP